MKRRGLAYNASLYLAFFIRHKVINDIVSNFDVSKVIVIRLDPNHLSNGIRLRHFYIVSSHFLVWLYDVAFSCHTDSRKNIVPRYHDSAKSGTMQFIDHGSRFRFQFVLHD